MRCCGKEVRTAFCPDCGKPIGGEPLMEIQRHIIVLLDIAEASQQRSLKWEKEHPDRIDEYRHEMSREAGDRKIAKFKRWAKAIEDAVTRSKKKR